MKKKNFLTILCLIVVAMLCLSVTACDENTTLEDLMSQYGIGVEGGGFEEGSVLLASEVKDSEVINTVKEAISELVYDKTAELFIFDISVSKYGVKVQPNGKVKVTIPAPIEDVLNYVVFHIKDSGAAEKLTATYADGKVSFETDSFSYFAVGVAQKTTITIGQKGAGGSVKINENTPQSYDGRLCQEDYHVGSQITLVATPRGDEYRFMGWFEPDETVLTHMQLKSSAVSTETTYSFAVTENNYTVYAVFEEASSASLYEFRALVGEQSGKIYDGETEMPNGYVNSLEEGAKVTLTATPDEGFSFKGWYEASDASAVALTFASTPVSTNATQEFTVATEDYTIYALFELTVNGLRLDGANAGFNSTSTTTTVTVGAENTPNTQNVAVFGTTVQDSVYLTNGSDYTIDDGGLNCAVIGTYTITYTYSKNTSITATLTVVVEEQKYELNVYVYQDYIGQCTVGFEQYYCPGGIVNENSTHCYYRTTPHDKLGVIATLGAEYVGYEIRWYEEDENGVLEELPCQIGRGFTPAMPERDVTVYVKIRPAVTSLRIDVANSGFASNGDTTYVIGNSFKPNANGVFVYGKNSAGGEVLLTKEWDTFDGINRMHEYNILFNDGLNNQSFEYVTTHTGTYTIFFVYYSAEYDSEAKSWDIAASIKLVVNAA